MKVKQSLKHELIKLLKKDKGMAWPHSGIYTNHGRLSAYRRAHKSESC